MQELEPEALHAVPQLELIAVGPVVPDIRAQPVFVKHGDVPVRRRHEWVHGVAGHSGCTVRGELVYVSAASNLLVFPYARSQMRMLVRDTSW